MKYRLLNIHVVRIYWKNGYVLTKNSLYSGWYPSLYLIFMYKVVLGDFFLKVLKRRLWLSKPGKSYLVCYIFYQSFMESIPVDGNYSFLWQSFILCLNLWYCILNLTHSTWFEILMLKHHVKTVLYTKFIVLMAKWKKNQSRPVVKVMVLHFCEKGVILFLNIVFLPQFYYYLESCISFSIT